MKHVLLGLAALTLSLTVGAQQFHCGFDEMRAKRIAEDPSYLQREAELEAEVQHLLLNSSEMRDRDVIITIPMVFHIIHLNGTENITNEQILNEMVLLNQDYSATNPDIGQVHPSMAPYVGNAEIRFELASLDPDGNCTNGIDRVRTPETLVGDDGSKMNPWPREKYLNVWVVRRMRDGVAGYAYYPGSFSDPISRLADGIIILNDYIGEIGTSSPNSSTALSHEVGHYLNLAHVWGNNNGGEEAGGNAPPGHMQADCGDDNVEDTPMTRGWRICPAPSSWANCNLFPVDSTIHTFSGVTTTSGTTDPNPAPNLVDSIFDEPRIRTTMGAFTANGVSANSSEAGWFAFTNWDQEQVQGEVVYDALPGSLNAAKYYAFTVTPSITDVLTIDSIGFAVKRNSTGVRTFSVRSSVDNYMNNLPIRTGGNTNISIQALNVAFFNQDLPTEVQTIYVDPPVNGFTNVSNPITFRIYGWNAENENGIARVCSNGSPIDLFDRLGNSPQSGGTWSGPSPTDGTFDPATMEVGTYTYTVDATSPCPAYSASVEVSFIDPPATPTISGPNAFCAGTSVTLMSSSSTANSWSSGQTTPNVSVNKAGTYTVTVTGTNGCKATSDPLTVSSIAVANAGGDDVLSVCDGSAAVPLFNSIQGNPEMGGSWTGPSPVTDGLYDPATMEPGDYTYEITGVSPCANDVAVITVEEIATANAGSNGTLAICQNGAPVDMFDNLGGSPQSGGTWTGMTATDGTFDPAAMVAGVYTYTVDPGAACGQASATVTVTVNNPPATPTIAGSMFVCAGSSTTLTSSTAPAYLWSPGGQTTSTITVTTGGTYTVKITDAGCSSTSAAFDVTLTPALNAGISGSMTACSGASGLPLFNSLQGTPQLGGNWTGPSTVVDGLYEPASMTPGVYTYRLDSVAGCSAATATVSVQETNNLGLVGGTLGVDNAKVYGTSGLLENVQNYMEYSYCSNMFTMGQVARMRAALNASLGERNNLWTDDNHRDVGIGEYRVTCPPQADFYARTVIGGSQTIPFSPTVCTGTTVQFIDNSSGSFPTGWQWTFPNGTPATSTERNPTVSFDTPGWKAVTLTVTNDNGSNTKTIEYSVLIGGAPYDVIGTYYESFENGPGIYPWFNMNYDASTSSSTFFQRTTAAHYSGNACAVLNSGTRNFLDLIDVNNDRDIDELISPSFDLSALTTGEFSFKYAYSTSTSNLADVTEALEVSVSTDCGKTWNLFQPGGQIINGALINNGNNPQLPPPAWTTKSYNLSASRLVEDVRFRFRFTSSAFSGNLYIDDINIAGTVGIKDLSPSFFMSLYPNPTNDHFSVAAYGMDKFNTDITVTDIRGAIVFQTTHRPAGLTGIELNASEMGLANGVYLIRASNEAGNSTQKLIVGK